MSQKYGAANRRSLYVVEKARTEDRMTSSKKKIIRTRVWKMDLGEAGDIFSKIVKREMSI